MKLDLVLACDSEQKEDEPAGSNPTEPSAADVPSTNVAQVPSPVAPETPSSTTSGLPGPAVSASSAPAVAASATPPEVAVDVANIGLHIGGGPNDVTKSPILTSLEPHFPAFRACFAREEEPRAHGPSISLRTAERQDDAEEDSSRYAAAKRRGAALKRTDRLARMARLALPSAIVLRGWLGSPSRARLATTPLRLPKRSASIILPLHGHVSTENPNIRLRSPAHGRWQPRCGLSGMSDAFSDPTTAAIWPSAACHAHGRIWLALNQVLESRTQVTHVHRWCGAFM